MKKRLMPFFCLLHLFAISWWALPHSVAGLSGNRPDSFEARLFQALALDNFPRVTHLLQGYIDLTGSQQYWDLFAPHSPKRHQYVSVCLSVIPNKGSESLACLDKPLFSNFDKDFDQFKAFGSDRSRFYRLTENLVKLEEPRLLQAFLAYHRNYYRDKVGSEQKAYLVLHQFELNPWLKGLPKAGYRDDKVLVTSP